MLEKGKGKHWSFSVFFFSKKGDTLTHIKDLWAYTINLITAKISIEVL